MFVLCASDIGSVLLRAEKGVHVRFPDSVTGVEGRTWMKIPARLSIAPSSAPSHPAWLCSCFEGCPPALPLSVRASLLVLPGGSQSLPFVR